MTPSSFYKEGGFLKIILSRTVVQTDTGRFCEPKKLKETAVTIHNGVKNEKFSADTARHAIGFVILLPQVP